MNNCIEVWTLIMSLATRKWFRMVHFPNRSGTVLYPTDRQGTVLYPTNRPWTVLYSTDCPAKLPPWSWLCALIYCFTHTICSCQSQTLLKVWFETITSGDQDSNCGLRDWYPIHVATLSHRIQYSARFESFSLNGDLERALYKFYCLIDSCQLFVVWNLTYYVYFYIPFH